MWAITSYFNSARYKRRLSNYRLFRANLRIPLVAVELSFDGRFELSEGDADILIQMSGGAVLWQKERLLNVALHAVPRKIDRIAWIDCDLILKRPDWVEEANRRLDEFHAAQLFSNAVHIGSEDLGRAQFGADGRKSVPSIVALSDARKAILVKSNENNYQSGFAWAAKRRILEEYGFYDAAIVGGGDCMMVGAALGQHDGIAARFSLSKLRRQHYFNWAIPFYESVRDRVGLVSGTIYHLSHGDLQNRRYGDRHTSLAAFNFDPDLDLRIGAQGAWEWARPRPELELFLKNYFIARAEDA